MSEDRNEERERITYLDLFPNVFLLLRLQCELDEDLLEHLVDVVYTELLELIGLSPSI